MTDPRAGHIFVRAMDSPPPHLIKLGPPALETYRALLVLLSLHVQTLG